MMSDEESRPPLPRFLKILIGVSLWRRPLLRLSRPGVSAALRRCKARMACGVDGLDVGRGAVLLALPLLSPSG